MTRTFSRILRLTGVTVGVLLGLAVVGLGVRRFVAFRIAVIRLYDARRAAVSIVNACGPKPLDDKMACYGQALSERVAQDGVAAAATMLDVLGGLDRAVAEGGHVLAHGIGIEAYGHYPDVRQTFVQCGDGYSSGCRHGVIQAYFEARDRVDSADVNGLCLPFRSALRSTWVRFQCVHGMGHGLTMFYGHDLPQALTACDLLQNPWDRESCYGGAFMENIVNATAPHHPATMMAMHHQHAPATFRALDPNEPLYPCTIVVDRYQGACYLVQTSAVLYLNHGDIPAAGTACARVPDKYRPTCYQSLGRDITAYVNRDTRESARLCALPRDADRRACYTGVAKALVDWTATPDSAFVFCQVVGGGRDLPSRGCYRALGEQLAALIWSGPDRAMQCARAGERAAVLACRRGARLRRDGV